MPFARGFGPLELIIILVIVMMIFGVGKLPQVGSAMGKALREFKSSSDDKDSPTETDSDTPTETDGVTPTAQKYDPMADGAKSSAVPAKESEKETPPST